MTGLATLETDRLRIIQRAEYHRACMQGLSREAMLDYLEGVFEACPIVTGVFPHADELVIVFLKGGGDLLQAAAAGGRMTLCLDEDRPARAQPAQRVVNTRSHGNKFRRHRGVEIRSPKPRSALERAVLVEDDSLVN